ncbi:EamA family transporter RarD [Microaceticoccus formicicus]|uniref:EamA family transporter RarD n=1 Tax=Microaceticoccus formicicus TaxID=3118105 RepID=UPI003CD041E5|nr:EamA family transporter RarD [Peptoniphilaceae bacterium AMB_02]
MRKGTLYILSCYVLWGLLPIYWKQLSSVDSIYVLASRILWSFVFCMIIILYKKNLGKVARVLKNKKQFTILALAGVMVTINWGLYIIAIHSGHILEGSLAYYMNPIMAIVIGYIVFKERLIAIQWISVLIAAIGVGYSITAYGKVPVFALAIGGSFAIYGALKKKINCDSDIALFIETLAVLPIAILIMIWKTSSGSVNFEALTGFKILLLPLSGAITSIPLIFFAEGMKTTSLATSGILMYVNPTLQLLVGVLIYGEEFTKANLITFVFVWLALILYLVSIIGRIRAVESNLQNVQEENINA